MKSEDVFTFFGGKTKAIAIISQLLKVSANKIRKWNELVPLRDAVQLEEVTKGKLKVTTKDYYGLNREELSKITNRYY